jgi:hypothetical protein
MPYHDKRLTPAEKSAAFAEKKLRAHRNFEKRAPESNHDYDERQEQHSNVVTRAYPGAPWEKIGQTVSRIHVSAFSSSL